ncbi:HAD family hydrolase [Singulisphaera sp. PoT]|uniref:HAD family hydrolase n=1 Tax=Singulisphaera sp. PoT TaxID=3411797 RepID=UPI003BF46BD7
MVKAVIFDIDGTILDSVDLHAEAWQKTLKHFGFDLPIEDVRRQIGKGGDQLMPSLLPKHVVDAQGEEIEKERADLFKREYLSQVRPFPRVRELFERIRADGKKIALASSAKADELETYTKIAEIQGLTDVETSSDDAERSKPHPDIFEAAAEKLGLPKDALIILGDTPHDAEAATKAGIRIIGVLCGGSPEQELRDAGCIVIYRDPADLLANYVDSPIAQR